MAYKSEALGSHISMEPPYVHTQSIWLFSSINLPHVNLISRPARGTRMGKRETVLLPGTSQYLLGIKSRECSPLFPVKEKK